MNPKRIVIIGGGIAGLTMAYRLQKQSALHRLPLEITILEASNRLGGLIETTSRDGFLLESGPDAFFTEKPWALDLVEELNLTDQLIPTNHQAAKSFIYFKNRFHQVPVGFHLTIPNNISAFLTSSLLSPLGKLRAMSEIMMSASENSKDESLADFIRRHFGSEMYQKVGQPMIGGIYSGNPETLSLKATMPRFAHLEKEFGSLIRGYKKQAQQARETSGPRYKMFYSFKNGMQTLTDALVQTIQNKVALNTGSTAATLRRSTQGWEIITSSGKSFLADIVCVALPAPKAARLCQNNLGALLASIPYESAATLNLAYYANQFSIMPQGFGFVVPSFENLKTIGCTFTSHKFLGRTPKDKFLIRVFSGGAFNRTLTESSESEIIRSIQSEIHGVLKIQGEPIFSGLSVYKEAMPQYTVGHFERVQKIEAEVAELEGLELAGNYLYGVGIPDTIHQASQIALKCLRDLKSNSRNQSSVAK